MQKKHARAVAIKGKRVRSRREALNAFRKSKKYKKMTNQFQKRPQTRPSYIPRRIARDHHNYTVVFYNHSYGYYYHDSFIPLRRSYYVIPDMMLDSYGYHRPYYRHRRYYSSSGSALWVFLVLFTIIVIFIIFVSCVQKAAWNRAETEQYYQAQPEKESAVPFTSSLPEKLQGIRKGKIVTLSDPLTLAEFDGSADFMVEKVYDYHHDSFDIRQLVLINNDKDELCLHLFMKSVEDEYALYLGILDHEGLNQNMIEENWKHLDIEENQFATTFSAIFTSQSGQEQEVEFEQYDFGAFYDVRATDEGEPSGLCEYYPASSNSLDWEHAIVTWQGEWISCYFCIEIHQHNLEIF